MSGTQVTNLSIGFNHLQREIINQRAMGKKVVCPKTNYTMYDNSHKRDFWYLLNILELSKLYEKKPLKWSIH
jgi:hypothetical protein